MKKTIKTPVKTGKRWTTKEHSYNDVLGSIKKSVKNLPIIIAELQKADEEKWGNLVEDLTSYVQNDKSLSKIIREEKDGLHIGANSWKARLLGMAFMYGYSIGNACYRSGACDYTTYID